MVTEFKRNARLAESIVRGGWAAYLLAVCTRLFSSVGSFNEIAPATFADPCRPLFCRWSRAASRGRLSVTSTCRNCLKRWLQCSNEQFAFVLVSFQVEIGLYSSVTVFGRCSWCNYI